MADYSKPDHWSLKAQKEGYPARSVYKLKEMDEKFGLLKGRRGAFKVLDLGAAPGSWSLYVLRKLAGRAGAASSGSDGGRNTGNAADGNRPARGQSTPPEPAPPLLVSIDLAPLSRQYDEGLFDKPEFFFIQGDFTLPEIKEKLFSLGPYNLLVSDAAPATTGNRSVDTLRSLELAETALDFAGNVLARGGNLAIKVFQGGDTGSLLKSIRSLFETGKSFKPQACRAESFETYYLGLGKK